MSETKEKWIHIWNDFEIKHPKAAKWIYQIFRFQHDGNGIPIFGLYIYAWHPWYRTGRQGIYVA